MKTTLIALAMTLVTMLGMSQKPEYLQAMGESLGQFSNCKTVDDFQSLGNRFSMIASAENQEWLPFYYHAQCYILMSFMEPQGSTKKDSFLDVAEKSITKIIELAPEEADVWALQSMFLSARLVVNPMERGQKYGMLSAQAVGQALGIDSTNPRARFMKLQNEMGTAQFFGKDPKEFCGSATELLNDWDNYKPKSPLHPSWGKSQVARIVNDCNL